MINCWAKEFPCKFSKKGIKYLDLNWPESNCEEITRMFDRYVPVVEEFMEKAELKGESVLVFCSNGQNRALCVVVTLLMKRFRWSFYKALEFLDSKRPNLEINKNYFGSLKQSCEKFEKQVKVSVGWDSCYLSESKFQEDEIIITNTFFNSKSIQGSSFGNNFKDGSSFRKTKCSVNKSVTGNRIIWADQLQPKPRRVIKSVGKVSVKKQVTETPVSVEPKKKREKQTLKTEVEESFYNEPGVSSEILKIMDLGKIKRVSEKGKFKKVVGCEIVKSKEDRIQKFLATVGISKLKIGSANDLAKPQKEAQGQKMTTSSNEFYKKNLKDLNRRIFSKQLEQLREEREKSASSKVSTNIQEESKQTPNDSENSPFTEFGIEAGRILRPTQTQISSFKENNKNDVFVEIQRNSKTAYQKDEFYKPTDLSRAIKKPDDINPKRSEGHVNDKLFMPSLVKNKDDFARLTCKNSDLKSNLKDFGVARFMKLPEEDQLPPSFKSIEKIEILKGKLVSNNGGPRPSSAPMKEDDRDMALQKHLFFEAKAKINGVNRFICATDKVGVFPKQAQTFLRDKNGIMKGKVVKLG